MKSFTCQECGASFEVPAAALAKYPGWTPKLCQAHRKGAGSKASAKAAGHARRAAGRGRRPAGAVEENLTLAQVLERYDKGPDTGLFTDGSSVPNPGPGGWGVVWVQGGKVREQRHGQSPRTTNNRMELQALIQAYRLLPEDAQETVHTDSKLCVDTITRWAPAWKRKGWKKKGGEIKNLELVQELFELHATRPGAKLQWIAAHSGNRWNEYADSLATAWMRDEL